MSNNKKLTIGAFILMILTSVFGVTNIGIGFYRMGYAAIPMFIIGGVLFFAPFLAMMIEFATGFDDKEGGIYTWMKESVSIKFAFVGIMMWYCSYVIWMFGKAFSIWVPLSYALFGKDITVNPVIIGGIDFGPFFLGLIGVAIIILLYFLVSRGASKLSKIASIGGMAVVSLNFVLIIGGLIAFVVSGFHLSEPLTLASLGQSPNPDYQSIVPFLGFLVFAVFAYGGTEAIGGVAEDLENPKRDLKKGIVLSGLFIIICYIVGFLMVGAAINWADFPAETGSMQALFIIMINLGDTIAGKSGSFLGEFLMRFSGLGIFLSYLGALIALTYAPLKQLITGTPKEFWPKSFSKENENGIRISALKVQALIVIAFILSKSILSLINPDGANAIYELIINMTNVGMTLPYVFLIYAWFQYRKNDQLPKNIIMIKSHAMINLIFVVSMITVLFGNVFTIVSPFLSGNISTGIWTIIGPVIFSILALVIYSNSNIKEK